MNKSRSEERGGQSYKPNFKDEDEEQTKIRGERGNRY